VITGLLWLGAVAFLLWFVITEMAKTKDSQYVTTSTSQQSFIQFPNMMICPSVEAAAVANNTIFVTASAYINVPNSFTADGTSRTYGVCPRKVTFNTKFNIGCIDFVSNPVQNLSATDCDPNSLNGYWFNDQTDPTRVNPLHPWAAVDEYTSIVMELSLYGSGQQSPLIHPYSSSSLEISPTVSTTNQGDFAQYLNTFSLFTPDTNIIPISAQSAVRIQKYTRDNYPDNKDCSFDNFATETHLFYSGTPGVNQSTASTVISYNDLNVIKECHRPVIGFSEVLGIIGGGMAIVLACTFLLQKAVGLCINRGTNGEREEKPYSALQ